MQELENNYKIGTRLEKGIVEKGWDKTKDILKTGSDKLLESMGAKRLNDTPDTVNNSSNQKYTQTADDSVLNKPPHNQSPLNNVDNSINDVAKNVK